MYPVIEREWGRSLPPDHDEGVKATIAARYATDLRPIPHVREALDRIDRPVCVASSSSRRSCGSGSA